MTDLELSDSETPVLEETYGELRLPLVRLAFMLTGSRETAEDVVQSAFASAQPRWPLIDDPPAYLRRSVVNLAKDGQRREFRRRRMLRFDAEPVTAIPEIDETWALVRSLPATQRSVVPPGTSTFTVDYLVDGQVLVPPTGERAEHVMPDQ